MAPDPKAFVKSLEGASIEEANSAFQELIAQAAMPKPTSSNSPYDAALSEAMSMPVGPSTVQGAVMGVSEGITASLVAGTPAQPAVGLDGFAGAAGQMMGDAFDITGAAVAGGTKEYQITPSGFIVYSNGVIADPTNGTLLSGPWEGDPDVVGSVAWLEKVKGAWSEDKLNDWRKRLANAGFEVAKQGGWGPDLMAALRGYHTTRYLNFGEPPKAAPQMNKKELKEGFDFQQIKERVKPWGQLPFQEDLDDDTAAYYADMAVSLAVELMKEKEWSPEQALAGAELRVQKKFIKRPEVAQGIEAAEDFEENTGLRQRLESAAQVFGSI